MPILRRLVGAGIFTLGVQGMAAHAETASIAPPEIITNSESPPTTPPQELPFQDSLPLVWQYKTEPPVMAYGAVAALGLATVIVPNIGRRNGRGGRSRTNHDGGGFFGIEFGGDSDGDGGDGGD